MLFSAKKLRNKTWNTAILEILKSNPQISCLQCSLKKLSTSNLTVRHVSDVGFV